MANGKYDVIVIGAGHNGLTAACLLAKRGRRVLVLERREVVGGLCAGEEFHPGYRSAGLLQDTACVRAGVADALRLVEHGLQLEPIAPALIPQEGGEGLLLAHDPGAAAAEIARHSARDAERYRDLHDFIGRIRGVVAPLLNEVPPDLVGPGSLGMGELTRLAQKGLAVRRLGRADMMELMRVPAMCVADWLNERFETPILKSALAMPAVSGTWTGPWSPGTAANLMAWMCTANRAVAGGPAALVEALGRAARHYGVEVRTGVEVQRVKVDSGVADGVVLDGGEEIHCAAVMSSCDPKTTFLQLLDPLHVSHALDRQVTIFRQRGTTAAVHLALSGPLEFASRPGTPVARALVVDTLDGIERAFDAVKYRRFADHPVLEVSTVGTSAPAGHAAVSILAHFAAHDLEGGWNDEQRERLGDVVVAELARVAPGVADSIVAREVLTPADIEARYGIRGGHIHHGEHALDQLIVRPTLDTARYRTPIANLYLCGSGSHPGGGVTCAPGALAASVVAG